jgi:hypothetical protein
MRHNRATTAPGLPPPTAYPKASSSSPRPAESSTASSTRPTERGKLAADRAVLRRSPDLRVLDPWDQADRAVTISGPQARPVRRVVFLPLTRTRAVSTQSTPACGPVRPAIYLRGMDAPHRDSGSSPPSGFASQSPGRHRRRTHAHGVRWQAQRDTALPLTGTALPSRDPIPTRRSQPFCPPQPPHPAVRRTARTRKLLSRRSRPRDRTCCGSGRSSGWRRFGPGRAQTWRQVTHATSCVGPAPRWEPSERSIS